METSYSHSFLSAVDRHAYPLANALAPVLLGQVGFSSAGYPYLEADLFRSLRDTLPLLFQGGQVVRDTVDMLCEVSAPHLNIDAHANLESAAKVVRTILNTAAVTAPPDLWLLRQVFQTWQKIGLIEAVLSQEGISPENCGLLENEIKIDLKFLLSRGYLVERGGRYHTSTEPRVLTLLQKSQIDTLPLPFSTPGEWTRFFNQESLDPATTKRLADFLRAPGPEVIPREHWSATWDEINLGYRWVPVLLGMHQSPCSLALASGNPINEIEKQWRDTPIGTPLIKLLQNAGVAKYLDGSFVPTSIGRRVFARATGPFGIIQAYQPYMDHLEEILNKGRQQVHVQRGPNVAASQLANRSSFEKINESLDSFCKDTGFSYNLYIEHALGRGEATRQRFEKNGNTISYVGADLEQASIDSAQAEQRKGHLPKEMCFLSGADIGQPQILLSYLRERELSPKYGVMIVGNGFHEVRGQTDERVIDIFRGYHDAGLILLFTEESALSVEHLLETAWNTYHAGFKYVHERSGQGLRPARKGPGPEMGPELPMSWHQCASHAGYFPLDNYTTRTRTIFPYAPQDGFNPAISVNHFFIPGALAQELELI
ncbi:MAG: hypothetical protein HOI23_12545 [Deltaproteobacteria bacterium]|nr:hypothetical protein [Deltaproteobacteria bacterium]MBT6434814.1 hypothetical protein [Deltaproteobacteria bacterium]MBT6492251.1 hypothetical protein [Deltaproteobacteria bacterium]